MLHTPTQTDLAQKYTVSAILESFLILDVVTSGGRFVPHVGQPNLNHPVIDLSVDIFHV